jgi:hypothetical protein
LLLYLHCAAPSPAMAKGQQPWNLACC